VGTNGVADECDSYLVCLRCLNNFERSDHLISMLDQNSRSIKKIYVSLFLATWEAPFVISIVLFD
jgi:hypothetical protein